MISLKEARSRGKLEDFIAEYENDPPGDMKKLESILRRAAETPKEARRASHRGVAADCTGTQTPQCTSGDASSKRGRASRGSSS